MNLGPSSLPLMIFAGAAGFDSNSHLIWIIHSANEQGYR